MIGLLKQMTLIAWVHRGVGRAFKGFNKRVVVHKNSVPSKKKYGMHSMSPSTPTFLSV